ncbi:MAG: 5-formyltetrahydrofolate cyclo-ligase [Methylobacteriaceae bacterium]|nr:5-formyltetrahydrofolate cyclo-ligase [Methylobacteriaceae bacterium]
MSDAVAPAIPDKTTLRAEALARRAGVDAATREAFARRLAALGPALAGRAQARVASVFSSFRGEPDTAPLMRALRSAGLVVALPVVVGRGAPLVFRRHDEGDALRPGPFGLSEPGDDAPALEPDLVFAPLAAFDRAGHRIGYGAGYYDRSLAGLRARRRILAVGVAFAAQEVATIPAEPHDERLDMIVTDSETLEFR